MHRPFFSKSFEIWKSPFSNCFWIHIHFHLGLYTLSALAFSFFTKCTSGGLLLRSAFLNSYPFPSGFIFTFRFSIFFLHKMHQWRTSSQICFDFQPIYLSVTLISDSLQLTLCISSQGCKTSTTSGLSNLVFVFLQWQILNIFPIWCSNSVFWWSMYPPIFLSLPHNHYIRLESSNSINPLTTVLICLLESMLPTIWIDCC